MDRHTDPQKKHVRKLDNNRFKCKFCKVKYSGGASRIKYHLSSVGGHFIEICHKVPRDVQQKVTREIEGPSSSRKRKALSSSSDDEDNCTESSSSQNQNNEVGIQARGNEDGSPMEVHNQEQQVEEGNHMDNNIGEPVQSVGSRGIAFRTEKFVGEAFQRNIDKIWAWLVNDDISSIGIYGMAGVGKTELAKHINNKLLKDSNPFHHVYWFDVPQDFTLYERQNAVAKKVGLHFSDEIGESERTAELSEALRNGKSILILDNVWNDIDLEKVGISISENGCKLILTTRSFDVCRVIACQKTIKVQCLDEEEDWYLFKEILGGYQTTLSDEVEEIAREVVTECEGLPLALITMARSMRGIVDVYEWRNALDKLTGLTAMQDYMDVFQKLKLSYDHLNNSAMQQCFLYCALFPIDIDREELIEYLIVEGIIERKRSSQQEIDGGHSMLNRLKSVCLLEETDRGVKMHKWIRKMAFQIQSSLIMVETDMELEELPDERKWTENLLRVLVFDTSIEEIPSNLSPSCSNLSTLLLVENSSLKLIPDSFFEKLSRLKVLNLSGACVETLPGSIFNLVGLLALLLKGCKELRHVPSLANLRELEKLDMSESGVEEVPGGMKLLTKLRYLDLSRTKLSKFPAGILPNLLRLHFLKLDLSISLLEVELKFLIKLETLQCGLDKNGCDLWLPLLNKCCILTGLQELKLHNWYDDVIHRYFHKIKKLVIENCGGTSLCNCNPISTNTYFIGRLEVIQLERLKNLQVLLSSPYTDSFKFLKEIKVNKCSSIKILFTPLVVSNLKNLEEIRISNCLQMEEIIAASVWTWGDATANIEITLPKLRTLHLRNLKELKSICKRKIICDSIQNITVIDCAKLKRMPLSLASLNERVPLPLCSTYNMQLSPSPLRRQIKVHPREWWESLEWDDPNTKNVLKHYVSFNYCYDSE